MEVAVIQVIHCYLAITREAKVSITVHATVQCAAFNGAPQPLGFTYMGPISDF